GARADAEIRGARAGAGRAAAARARRAGRARSRAGAGVVDRLDGAAARDDALVRDLHELGGGLALLQVALEVDDPNLAAVGLVVGAGDLEEQLGRLRDLVGGAVVAGGVVETALSDGGFRRAVQVFGALEVGLVGGLRARGGAR